MTSSVSSELAGHMLNYRVASVIDQWSRHGWSIVQWSSLWVVTWYHLGRQTCPCCHIPYGKIHELEKEISHVNPLTWLYIAPVHAIGWWSYHGEALFIMGGGVHRSVAVPRCVQSSVVLSWMTRLGGAADHWASAPPPGPCGPLTWAVTDTEPTAVPSYWS